MESSLFKIGILVVLVLLVAVRVLRPRWFKAALVVAGALVGLGAAAAYMSRARRLRQLGLDQAEAERISTIIGRAEKIRERVGTAEELLERDKALAAKQKEIEAELRRISETKEVDVDAVRQEIRLHFPDF